MPAACLLHLPSLVFSSLSLSLPLPPALPTSHSHYYKCEGVSVVVFLLLALSSHGCEETYQVLI